jgi:hypothetical protein
MVGWEAQADRKINIKRVTNSRCFIIWFLRKIEIDSQ